MRPACSAGRAEKRRPLSCRTGTAVPCARRGEPGRVRRAGHGILCQGSALGKENRAGSGGGEAARSGVPDRCVAGERVSFQIEHAADRVVLAACVFGALAGGLFAVRKIGRSTLLVGAGVGAILFLLLLSIGALLFASVSLSNGGAAILLSCLCGGAMAGILGARRKKRKR